MFTSARASTLPFQIDFSASELALRRRQFLAEFDGGLAVLASAPEVPGYDPIRQDNDFYYLTGIEVSHAYLTLDVKSGRGVLYLPPHDPKHEKSDGPTLCDEDGDAVRARTGIEEVRPLSRLVADLTGLSGTIWIAQAPAENIRQCQDTLRHWQRRIAADPLDARPSREAHLRNRIAELSPDVQFRDFSPALHR
ncbi:MAG: hypothetical protein RIQ79_1128, partial [Verrucomicrobiota bacterium]